MENTEQLQQEDRRLAAIKNIAEEIIVNGIESIDNETLILKDIIPDAGISELRFPARATQKRRFPFQNEH
jgi:hypothetical protein